jgi:hypothetical protein
MSRVRKEITDIFHRNGRRSRGHFVISRLRVIDRRIEIFCQHRYYRNIKNVRRLLKDMFSFRLDNVGCNLGRFQWKIWPTNLRIGIFKPLTFLRIEECMGRVKRFRNCLYRTAHSWTLHNLHAMSNRPRFLSHPVLFEGEISCDACVASLMLRNKVFLMNKYFKCNRYICKGEKKFHPRSGWKGKQIEIRSGKDLNCCLHRQQDT